MSLELKNFQTRTLDTLKEYLEKARLYGDPEQAFAAVARTSDGRVPTYHKVPGLEQVPYVCLRLPTGGGKTIVGAYAIRVAAHSYIEKDFPVVLWLVPTNTIRTQTADALKNPAHPYRIALDEAFEGRVRVFDISEIETSVRRTSRRTCAWCWRPFRPFAWRIPRAATYTRTRRRWKTTLPG